MDRMETEASRNPNASDSPAPGTRRVVVCGGGVVGVCTAYYLAQKGAKVVVVEKCAVACAASGKAGGFLALDWCRGPVDNLARLSFKLHKDLGHALGNKYEYRSVTTLSVQLEEPPPGATPKGKRASGRGLPGWIDGPVTRYSEIGSPVTNAQVHPRLFTETLLEDARTKYGVELKIGEVQGLETVEESSEKVQRVKAVVVDGELVPADAVVFALGPWTSQLKLLSSFLRISGLKANSVVLKPKSLGSISASMLFLQYRDASGRVTEPEVYPRSSGQVYVCGMSSEGDPPKDPLSIQATPAAPEYLTRVAATVSSELQDAELVTAQACYLPCTDDGLPVIGPLPGFKGAYVGTGHSCWGILNAPATGLALAELIMDGSASSIDISAFSAHRFSRASSFR